MKKLSIVSAFIAFVLAIYCVGCSDAQLSQFSALGEPGYIKCYSGGTLIYEGKSTGKISTESQSDGWFFKDSKTGKLIRVSGDCLIEN